MKILIFIPARGGSKGIIGKNLVELNEKPLIQYTLEIADKLSENNLHLWIPFISTDDDKIISFCKTQGFKMEYRRPDKLAGDKSSIIDSVWDGLKWLKIKKNISIDAVLLLQPTSPLRDSESILGAIEQLNERKDVSIASTTKMYEHPYECIRIKNNEWQFLEKPPKELTCRQEYEDNYLFIDGNFYFATIEYLKKYNSFIVENKSLFYTLDQRFPLDIDEYDDLLMVEYLLSVDISN